MAEISSSSNNGNRAIQRALQQEEAELRAKLAQIKRQYDDAMKDYDTRTKEIKEKTTKDVELELGKREIAVSQEQQKGYDSLLAMKRQYDKALRNTSQTAEKDLRDIRLKSEVDKTMAEQEGGRKIEEHKRKTDAELAFETGRAEMEIAQAKNQAQMQREIAEGEHQQNMNEVRRRSELELGQARDNFTQAKQKTLETYATTHQSILDEHQKILQDTQSRANTNLKGLQQTYSRNLATYEDRLNDPFYQLMQVPTELTENEDAIELRAVIPKHEQNSVQVSIKGNKVVLSGTRRSEEMQKVPESGETRRTSAFQTYAHEFPLSVPVNSAEMTKEWSGDMLIARFPKRGNFQPYQPRQAPERMTQEKPTFPANLQAAIPPERVYTPTDEQSKSATQRRTEALEGGPISQVSSKRQNTPLTKS